MAEYGSYSIPSGALDVWERRKNQKRLGGYSYDPQEATAFMKGVIEGELSKMLARRKLAEDKETKDKALALQELSIANTKEYQDQVLEQQADARKDAAEASLISAGLRGASLLFNNFLKGNPEKPQAVDPMARMRQASDYFKSTNGSRLGGPIPGGETGGTTGAASYFSPEDTGNAFMMQASSPAPAIGTDVSKAPSSTYDVMTRAYEDSAAGDRPVGAYRMASRDTGTMNDLGGQLSQPAIGSPVSGPDMPGVQTEKTTFENTGLETTNAAEPIVGGQGSSSSSAASAEAPNYEPPKLPEFQPPELEPFTYNRRPSNWTEKMWLAEGGEYGRDWESEFETWQGMKYAQDAAAARAKYNAWASEQNALAREAYDTWASKQNREAEKAYETSLADTGEEASPWSFNSKRLGGASPLDDYYGSQFTPAYEDMNTVLPPAFDPTGFSARQFTPVDSGKNKAYETLTRFTGGAPAFPSVAAPSYEPLNYEPPSYGHGSPSYSGHEAFNYEPAAYEPFNYEPAPSYESPYTYSSYNYSEPANYEPGPFGGGGKIVCTELNRRGYLSDEVLAKDSECRKRHIPENVYAGYLTLFGPVVALMRRWKAFANIVRPFGVATAREMASRVDPNTRGNLLGKALLGIGVPLCRVVGDVVLNAMATWARATTEVKHG